MFGRKKVDESEQLLIEEDIVKARWKSIIGVLKEDPAYIWSDKVKKDFEAIGDESKKIRKILKRLRSRHKDNERYEKEMHHVDALLKDLKGVRADKAWLREIYGDLQVLFTELNEDRKSLPSSVTEEEKRKRYLMLRSFGWEEDKYYRGTKYLIENWSFTLSCAYNCPEDKMHLLFKLGLEKYLKYLFQENPFFQKTEAKEIRNVLIGWCRACSADKLPDLLNYGLLCLSWIGELEAADLILYAFQKCPDNGLNSMVEFIRESALERRNAPNSKQPFEFPGLSKKKAVDLAIGILDAVEDYNNHVYSFCDDWKNLVSSKIIHYFNYDVELFLRFITAFPKDMRSYIIRNFLLTSEVRTMLNFNHDIEFLLILVKRCEGDTHLLKLFFDGLPFCLNQEMFDSSQITYKEIVEFFFEMAKRCPKGMPFFPRFDNQDSFKYNFLKRIGKLQLKQVLNFLLQVADRANSSERIYSNVFISTSSALYSVIPALEGDFDFMIQIMDMAGKEDLGELFNKALPKALEDQVLTKVDKTFILQLLRKVPPENSRCSWNQVLNILMCELPYCAKTDFFEKIGYNYGFVLALLDLFPEEDIFHFFSVYIIHCTASMEWSRQNNFPPCYEIFDAIGAENLDLVLKLARLCPKELVPRLFGEYLTHYDKAFKEINKRNETREALTFFIYFAQKCPKDQLLTFFECFEGTFYSIYCPVCTEELEQTETMNYILVQGCKLIPPKFYVTFVTLGIQGVIKSGLIYSKIDKEKILVFTVYLFQKLCYKNQGEDIGNAIFYVLNQGTRSCLELFDAPSVTTKDIADFLVYLQNRDHNLFKPSIYPYGVLENAAIAGLFREINFNLQFLKELADKFDDPEVGELFNVALPACADVFKDFKYNFQYLLQLTDKFKEVRLLLWKHYLPKLRSYGFFKNELTYADIEFFLSEIIKNCPRSALELVFSEGFKVCSDTRLFEKIGSEKVREFLILLVNKCPEKSLKDLFTLGILACAHAGLFEKIGHEKVGEFLIGLARRCPENVLSHLLQPGITVCAVTGLFEKIGHEKVREFLILLVNKCPEKSLSGLFEDGLLECVDAGLFEKIGHEKVGEFLIGLANKCPENTSSLFQSALLSFSGLITSDNYKQIVDKVSLLASLSKGTEEHLYSSMGRLKPLFGTFGEALFDDLLIPTAEKQTVGTFLCLDRFKEVHDFQAISSKEDIQLLRAISTKYPIKANDILKHIVVEGLKEGIIQKPLSKERDILLSFLKSAPAYLLSIYEEYRNIITSEDHAGLKLERAELLFSDIRALVNDIFRGTLSKEYPEKILAGVLYSVFSPEITLDRSQYKVVFDRREDRQADIPAVLDRLSGVTVKISKGGHKLKEGETLEIEAWNMLTEVVDEVNKEGVNHIDAPEIGLWLLSSFFKGELRKENRLALKRIYQFSYSTGNILPAFGSSHETLLKYKEFIGDRLNDLIFALLSEAQEKQPEKFEGLMQGTSKKVDYGGLANTLAGVWKSRREDKESIIKGILERNGFYIEESIGTIWSAKWTKKEIRAWLESLRSNVIEKSLVQRIKNEICGEDYEKMQKEVQKFEFSKEGGAFGPREAFTFHISKRKLHSVAMFNMGVCVAPDDKLWNSPDFWQMIIFNQEHHGCGGVIYRTIEDGGKRYLIASIQPSQGILSAVSPEQVYNRIIDFSRLMVRRLKYDALLVPQSSSIHSNRSSIQTIISSKNYPVKNLEREYDFSYSPYHYEYQSFYVV